MDTHIRTLFSCSLILYLSGWVTTFDCQPRLVGSCLNLLCLDAFALFSLFYLFSSFSLLNVTRRLLNLTEPGSIHARTLGLDKDVTAADRAVWQRMLDGLAKFPEQQSPYGTIFAVRTKTTRYYKYYATRLMTTPLTPLSNTSHYGTTVPFPSVPFPSLFFPSHARC
jgi:hypothetical protein